MGLVDPHGHTPTSVSYVSAVANDNAPEHALRPGFLSTFALATDQGSKLGLSKNKSIICYYNTYQVSNLSTACSRQLELLICSSE
ncbi:Mitogen-activated protein kinase kinase 1-interacting protein 1 [Anas platyrhynchos]|uniref:Mitogen-activated protein kinase kinase 1-interacting protein 1 n=1 Tax=Anas platyrhynchos TaxID=8839 RepID=R0JF91_ANAPL|nr:Mitogen-activated protein kinase kinase 1-interacting protein 1 [Anas platyrhynchos]